MLVIVKSCDIMYKNAREHEKMPPLYFFIKNIKEERK